MNPLAYVLALGAIGVVCAVIWYFFMVPLGKERHERELQLIRRKLAQREAGRQADGNAPGDRTSG